MCGLALGGVEPLVLRRRLAGPDRMGLATGDPEPHRPARLDCDLGRLPLVGGVPCDLLAALGLAEPNAAGEREASGTDVKQRQAQMAYRARRVEVDGIYGLASDDLCMAFQREKGPTPDGVVGRASGR
jgi:murein L,D-transpeptidase YcbB/YkuD